MRLDDYLRRIGQPGPADRSVETLRRLHLAHRETFLFENLTIRAAAASAWRWPISSARFLDEGRGGYCFEHNTLFAAALGEAGFTTTTLLGRVRRGPPALWSRTHMVLRVPVDGEDWLADVGFGSIGLVEADPAARRRRRRAGRVRLSPAARRPPVDPLGPRRRRRGERPAMSSATMRRRRWTSRSPTITPRRTRTRSSARR